MGGSTSIRIFDVGKSGLMASKSALSTTGHNIANVNTEGFSRQRVEQTSGPTIPAGAGQGGTGVRISGITRANDEYLNRRIEKETKHFGAAEERDIYLSQAEQIFNEANTDGLNRLTTNFFNDFRKLSTQPEDTAVRSAIRESGKRLTRDIYRMNLELREIQSNIDARLDGYVGEFNSLTKLVRDFNNMIDRASLGEGEAPDLLDQRDVAMKRLGELAEISVSRDESNMVTITLAGKVAVVSGSHMRLLETRRTPANAESGKRGNSVSVYAMDHTPFDITSYLKQGRMGSLVEVRDTDLKTSYDQLNDVAFALANSVNALHSQGFGADDVTGRNFFSDIRDRSSAAESLKLSDAVLNSADAIAAGRTKGAPGDNRIAIAISNLSSAKGFVDGSDKTIADLYNAMVGELGTKAGSATRTLHFQKDVLGQLEGFKESLVGVNLDEETTNLVRFQHAYAANAKVITVADEMMQTILNAF